MNNSSSVKILPLGGLGEIGMNMMAVIWEDSALIIDAGLMFPDGTMPGVDLVIPDLDVLTKQPWSILGVVITHGHEDHIGALPYFLERVNAPVYATNLTLGLVEHKLEEFGLLESTSRKLLSTDVPVELGPFRIECFAMCHSIADSVGLAVTTPAGTILHSGDFKMDADPVDGRVCDLGRIADYAREGVLALLSDSTNAEIEGYAGAEKSVRPALRQILKEAPGRVLIATFSSNIHRIQQVLDLAQESDRKVALVGRSMIGNVRIAAERGYLTIPNGTLLDVRDADTISDNKLTILSTGSQGEPLSTLALMAYDRHKHLKVKPDDVLVLSSRFIPGNEKAINHIINQFARQGAWVEYERVRHVHVSGHACGKELRSLIRLVRPLYFIPIHGEYRHLRRHARLAVEEGIPADRVMICQDGELIEISGAGARIIDRIDLKRVYVDGTGVGDIDHEVLRDRRVLSEVGLVTVALAVQSGTGALISGPQVISVGVTYLEPESDFVGGIRGAVEERLGQLAPRTPEEWEQAKEGIRLAVRRHVNRVLGRKPVVQTMILET
jgi:ribonuclease J